MVAVAKMIVPNIMAHAIVETGATEAAEAPPMIALKRKSRYAVLTGGVVDELSF